MSNARKAVWIGISLLAVLTLGINVLGVMAIDPLAQVMIQADVLADIDLVSSYDLARFLNIFLPFILVSLILLVYLLPLGLKFNRYFQLSDVPAPTFRRILGTPPLIASLTGAGWLLGLPVTIIGWQVLGLPVELRHYLQYTAHSVTLFGFSFVLNYYSAEAVIQNIMVPRIFRESLALQVGTRFSLSIPARLGILAVSTFVLPTLVLGTAIVILNNEGNNVLGRDLIPIFSIILTDGGGLIFLITLFKSLSIETPLTELTQAAHRIGQGDLNVRVTVRSVDKLGQLGGAFNNMSAILKSDTERIAALNREIELTQREVIFTMGTIGESRSRETGNHVKRVAEYSKRLALYYGLAEQQAELLKLASPMHDIGKVGIPDSILKKPGKLTPDEFEIMKQHAQLGYDMLCHSERELLKAASIVAFEHHEKFNGSGYPRGLEGSSIHIFARITAIADVFDALGSDRVYKKAWTDEDIFTLLREQSNIHFDPDLVEIFFKNLPDFLRIRDSLKD